MRKVLIAGLVLLFAFTSIVAASLSTPPRPAGGPDAVRGGQNLPSAGDNVSAPVLVLDERGNMNDGKSGAYSVSFDVPVVSGSATLTIDARLKLNACGCSAWGVGEMSITISDPTGLVRENEAYSETTTVHFAASAPADGNWRVRIDATAVGNDFNLEYEIKATLGL